MEHSNNISTIDNLAEFIVSTNDNSRNNGMTGKSKGDLMKAVYGENYSNVDSALPLGLLEEMNINNDERWRYVMDYQNNYGGRLTDLINSIAEKNPNVVVYDNEYEEVDNLPILSAMEKYKNSNYMFDFNIKYNTGGSVNDYIDEKVDEFDADETEMRQQYRGYVRDIEYQGFLAIDTSLTPHERLSDYEFDGEEFDRDNLLEVAKMYPQAEYITFHARLMGDSDFGIEDELSPIDDLAMSFDMNKLNQYGNGGLTYGKTDDVYFEVASLLDSKLRKHKADMNGKEYIPKKTYGLESFKEFIKKYEDDERYEVDVPIELFTKESFNQYNSEDSKLRFIQGTIKLLGKDDLLKKLTTSKYLSSKEIDKINNKRIIKNAPEKTTIVKRIVSKQLLENGGNVNDYFAILTEQLESKYGEDSMTNDFYGRFSISKIKNGIEVVTDSEEVFNEIKEDYANDIIFEYPTYYQLEIKDSDENLTKIKRSYPYASWRYINDDRIVVKTEDLQTFEEIQNNLNDGEILFIFPPMYKLGIGNNYEQVILKDKKVIGQQGNVIVNPKEVSSVVEDKIADFMKYVQRNTNFTTTSSSMEFDDLVLSFYSSLRDYIDEVFNDSPTEVESIEEIDFEDEIENFIIYFTSDEEKREQLRNLMLDYLDDDNDTNEEISGDNLRYQVPTNNLYRRLQFINEDIKRVFKYAPKELLDFKVEGWEDIGTLLSNIEIASDLTDNASDDWKGSKINMANELANEKYLNSIPLEKKTRILQSIADHYGISEEQAYAEITDIESSALYEYITDQNLKMHVYQMMK